MTPKRALGILLAITTLTTFPFVAGPVAVNLANQVALASIAALGLTLLMGTAGLISLGHAALLGAGGFSVGVLTQEFGAPVWVTLPAACLLGSALGLIVGLPSLRLRGVYLVLSTLALHFVVIYLGAEYQTRRQAATGIVIPDPTLGSFTLSDRRAWFFFLLAILLVVMIVSRNLLRTRTGRAWKALQHREIAASSVGVNVPAAKLSVFVISSAMTSLAGALGAYYQHFVAVEGYTLFMTVQYLAMVLIGGVTSIVGALAGAAFVVLLPHLVSAGLGALPVPPQLKLYSFALQFALFGVLMGVFVVFEPGGLVSLGRRIARRPKRSRIEPIRKPEWDDLLVVHDLSVAYGHATAVSNVSLRVARGSIVAILGANGAGKSTTLRAIGGLLSTEPARIMRGDIRLSGESVVGWSPDQVTRAGVVLVPERDKVFSTLTVEQNLAVARRRGAESHAEAVLRHFSVLEERRRVLAGYLSGGERQMLAIATALLCQPRVLLVDELSLGLAPIVVDRLMQVLGDLRRELDLTVVLVEQNATAALAVADYAYVLSAGRLVKHGLARSMRVDAELQSVYLGLSA